MSDLERYRAGAGDDLVELVRKDFAPTAPPAIVGYFLRVAAHRGLDPWASEIAIVPRASRKTGEVSWHYEVTIAGRRLIAARTGRLRGIGPPEWCGPRRFDEQGQKLPLEWEGLWDDDDQPPYAARVEVHVAGWEVPSVGVAKWSEFAVYLDPEKRHLGPFWKKAPAHQLAKVAESMALRRGFSEVRDAVAGEKHPLGTSVPIAPAPAGDGPPESYYDSLPESLGQ